MRLALLAVFAAALGFLPIESPLAATSPPTFSTPSFSANEDAGTLQVPIVKSAKGTTYSKVNVQTVDGTAKAGVDYKPVNVTLTFGNNTLQMIVPVPVINRAGDQGLRSFQVKITPVRYAGSSTPGTIYIHDISGPTPPPPDPTPPPPAATCPDGSPMPADGVCPTPTPPPPTSGWISAPLAPGGCARLKAAGSGAPKPSAYFPTPAYSYANVYRSGAAGEVFKVDANPIAYSSDNRQIWELHAISGEETLYFYADEIEGVAPAQ